MSSSCKDIIFYLHVSLKNVRGRKTNIQSVQNDTDWLLRCACAAYTFTTQLSTDAIVNFFFVCKLIKSSTHIHVVVSGRKCIYSL